MKGGFVLVEATLSAAILSLALVTLVPTFLLTIKANKTSEQTKIATQLSAALLEEIRLRRWDELTPLPPRAITLGSSSLGVNAGESSADKRTFEDIDDFNGWTESLPQDPVMQPLTDFGGYRRTVTVGYVTALLAASATPTDYKQVSVCTQGPKGGPACLDTLFTNR